MIFLKIISSIYFIYKGIKNRILRIILRPSFAKCGKNVKFDVDSSKFTFGSIIMGNDIYIGPNANFSASDTYLKIGNKVLFGPNVTIMCGNHNTEVVGKYMFDVNYKNENDDLPVIIEDDVWVGANAIILKGVTISQGSIIAAGSIVTKSTKPYSINLGIPAKFHRYRWTPDVIKTHKERINNLN